MKNVSLAINAILIIAVAVLFYLHFKTPVTQSKINTVKHTTAAVNPTSGQPLIAYVELDSLNEKISFIKNKRKELEAEQRAIENEWQAGYSNLEKQRDNFLKKGNSITQEEAEKMQNSLLQQQQQIDSKKQTLIQKLSERSYKSMEDIQKQLKEFLEDYNKQYNYSYILTTGTGLDYMVFKDSTLDITNDVIDGMNEKMKAAKK
ncbi:MAG: OmpH family outer membrane protein [Ferruginibacter sp.]